MTTSLQRDYDKAKERYHEALLLFRTMNEPAMEAIAWHQLGMVAEEQKQWAEAEDEYFRVFPAWCGQYDNDWPSPNDSNTRIIAAPP